MRLPASTQGRWAAARKRSAAKRALRQELREPWAAAESESFFGPARGPEQNSRPDAKERSELPEEPRAGREPAAESEAAAEPPVPSVTQKQRVWEPLPEASASQAQAKRVSAPQVLPKPAQAKRARPEGPRSWVRPSWQRRVLRAKRVPLSRFLKPSKRVWQPALRPPQECLAQRTQRWPWLLGRMRTASSQPWTRQQAPSPLWARRLF